MNGWNSGSDYCSQPLAVLFHAITTTMPTTRTCGGRRTTKDPFVSKVVCSKSTSRTIYWSNQAGVDDILLRTSSRRKRPVVLVAVAAEFDLSRVDRHNNAARSAGGPGIGNNSVVAAFHIPISEHPWKDTSLFQTDVPEHRLGVHDHGLALPQDNRQPLTLLDIFYLTPSHDIVVACHAGVNRSASCLALLLMTLRFNNGKDSLTLERVLAHLRKTRSCMHISANVNMPQLQWYDEMRARHMTRVAWIPQQMQLEELQRR